jgi:hypothetical protein
MVQGDTSPELNPEPEIVTVWPPLPEIAESAIEGAVTVKLAETDGPGFTTAASVKYTVYGPVTVAATVKLPVNIPVVASMEQAGVPNRPVGMEVSSVGQVADESPVLNPDPDSVTVIPNPPLLGVTTSIELTINWAVVTSFGTDPVNSPVKVRV